MAYTEIESLEQLHAYLDERGTLAGAAVQGLDLRYQGETLRAASTAGAVFLGCRMEAEAHAHLDGAGALVLPPLPPLPYRPFRPRLYTADELMEGYVRGDHHSFARATADGAIYTHYALFRKTDAPVPILEALSQRIHDHAIDDAMYDLLHNGGDPRRVVAIMGGHGMKREEPAFLTVARTARALTREGYFVTSGGGPGAMEAANLGAYFAAHADADLVWAVGSMAQANDYHAVGYFDRAYDVRDRFPEGAESLAIPTWFYGHEPANIFASHIAKYFANSIREDGLLAIARHGVIFAPGSAGTIQEIFQDATQNHYVTFGQMSPMVFFGEQYWTENKPVYPLLRDLAAGRPYARLITICDEADEMVAFIKSHPPEEV